MLPFSVFLLATSALVGAAVLPQGVDKVTTYRPDTFPVQPVQKPLQQNVFLHQQPKNAAFVPAQPVQQQQPFVYQAQPVVPQHYQSRNSAVQPEIAAYHQVGVLPQQPIDVEPKHHAVGHDEVVPRQAASARILQQYMDVNLDGSFTNEWNSDNGINVREQGSVKQVDDTSVAVQNGEISYVDDEGKTFYIKYVADETGFHVEGDHLPTPPPIPAAILRSLQYNEQHPETTSEPQEQYQPGQQGQYHPGQGEQGQYQPGQQGQYHPGHEQGKYQPGQGEKQGQYQPGQQGQYQPGQPGHLPVVSDN